MIERIENHVERGLDHFITQYKDKPRMAAFLGAFLEEVQLLEDAAWSVIVDRLIDNALGVQLDVLGKIVGQPRVGNSDDEYRLYIKARIAVNVSDGTADDVMRVAGILLEGLSWTYEDVWPASITVTTFELEEFAPIIAELVRSSKAGGVGFGFHFAEEPEDEVFGFSGSDEEEDDDAGFGGDDPDGDDGGAWIGAY